MSAPAPRRGEAGFTLLELLVAMAVFGLVVVGLASGVRFAGRAWQTQQARSERHGDLEAVQNLLRQLLVSASDFRGDGTSLRFVAWLPQALGRGGLFDITLRQTADRLILSWAPHFPGPFAGSNSGSEVLLTGITAARVSYYLGAKGVWADEHADRNLPPALIRLVVEHRGNRWPPLTVAPRLDVRPGFAR